MRRDKSSMDLWCWKLLIEKEWIRLEFIDSDYSEDIIFFREFKNSERSGYEKKNLINITDISSASCHFSSMPTWTARRYLAHDLNEKLNLWKKNVKHRLYLYGTDKKFE